MRISRIPVGSVVAKPLGSSTAAHHLPTCRRETFVKSSWLLLSSNGVQVLVLCHALSSVAAAGRGMPVGGCRHAGRVVCQELGCGKDANSDLRNAAIIFRTARRGLRRSAVSPGDEVEHHRRAGLKEWGNNCLLVDGVMLGRWRKTQVGISALTHSR